MKSVVDESLCIISPIKGTLWTLADAENCLNKEGSWWGSRRDNSIVVRLYVSSDKPMRKVEKRMVVVVVQTGDGTFWKKRGGDAGRGQLERSRARASRLGTIPLLFAGKLGVQPQVTDLLHAVSLVGMWIRILITR